MDNFESKLIQALSPIDLLNEAIIELETNPGSDVGIKHRALKNPSTDQLLAALNRWGSVRGYLGARDIYWWDPNTISHYGFAKLAHEEWDPTKILMLVNSDNEPVIVAYTYSTSVNDKVRMYGLKISLDDDESNVQME